MEANSIPAKIPVIELSNFKTLEAFCLECVGTINEALYVDADGKSVEDIADEQNHPWVVSIQLVKIGEGIGIFNDQKIKVRTKTLEALGRKYFLDAKTYTRKDLDMLPLDTHLTMEQKNKLIAYMENNKKEKLVRTRAGSWVDYNEEDRLLNTKTQEITSA